MGIFINDQRHTDMKKYGIILIFLTTCLTITAQPLFVGSYNIRYKNHGDSINGNSWEKRCQVISDQINFMQPDIFGTQEVLIGQLHDLDRALPHYAYIGVGRDDGKEAGEYEAIFFRKDKIKLLKEGHFWLSETPEKPGLGWDAACVRVCSWGLFKDKTTKLKFYFFNLHMDHVGIVARREAAKLVVKRIKEITNGKNPVILTGDFNVDQHNEIYQTFTSSGLLNDSYVHAQQRLAENGTFNSFNPYLITNSRIDHVFVSPRFKVENYGLLTSAYWTEDEGAAEGKGHDAPQEIGFKIGKIRLPSDHYPVFVRLNCK